MECAKEMPQTSCRNTENPIVTPKVHIDNLGLVGYELAVVLKKEVSN